MEGERKRRREEEEKPVCDYTPMMVLKFTLILSKINI